MWNRETATPQNDDGELEQSFLSSLIAKQPPTAPPPMEAPLVKMDHRLMDKGPGRIHAPAAAARKDPQGKGVYRLVVDPRTKPKLPSVGDWLCGAPRGCGGLEELPKFLLKQSGEGLANAGKRLRHVVAEAGSAATLVVDDFHRHTLERVKVQLTQKHGRRQVVRAAPTVCARLRALPPTDALGPSQDDQNRLRHSDSIVRVAAEHPAMAPLSFVLDRVIGPDSDQAAAYASIGAPAVEACCVVRAPHSLALARAVPARATCSSARLS